MTNPSQLFLLADHIKLSLLERQRAISLELEPNSQDGEISRSLDSLREGLEALEATQARLESLDDPSVTDTKEQAANLRTLYLELSSQFYQDAEDPSIVNDGVQRPTDPYLAEDFAHAASTNPALKHPVPQHPPSKSVRFTESPPVDEEEERRRAELLRPYRDEPSPPPRDQSNLSNVQIHAHHDQVMRDQDEQLDQLGESIGRQHQLSIQIGDELDGQATLLDEFDGQVDRHTSRLGGARQRLDKFRRKSKDSWGLMTIIGLIIVLVILIVILK